MILNLIQDTTHAVAKIKTKSKGSWKQKHISKKQAIHHLKKKLAIPTANAPDTPQITPQNTPTALQNTPQNQNTHQEENHAESQKKSSLKRNYISSIFTASDNLDTTDSRSKEKTITENINPFSNHSFSDLGLDPIVVQHLDKKLDIHQPTPIQSYAIQKLLANDQQDFIIQALTGSGKSLAFLLPVIHKLLNQEYDFEKSRAAGTLGILLVPTRELAKQLHSVLESILCFSSSKHKHWIVPGVLMGGESRKSEKARIRKGITLLVSTPGRLLDHLKNTDCFKSDNLRYLILDEADHLLELGFEETLLDILKHLNQKTTKKVTTVLCSATIKDSVKQLANKTLSDPLYIHVKETRENNETVPKQLLQSYAIVPPKLRLVTLLGYLKKTLNDNKGAHLIVFFSCCDSVNFHFDIFTNGYGFNQGQSEDTLKNDQGMIMNKSRMSLINTMDQQEKGNPKNGAISEFLGSETRIYKLHGNMSQEDRKLAYNGFTGSSKETCKVLFSTDVSARGLDLPNVSHIVQYDPPCDTNDYIRIFFKSNVLDRIGRTGRLGKIGNAFIFLLPTESEYLEHLKKFNIEVNEQKIVPFLNTLVDSKFNKLKKHAAQKDFEIAATEMHMSFENYILSNAVALENAKKAYMSHIRAYATHVGTQKSIFHVKKLHLGHVAKSFGLRDAPVLAVQAVQMEKKQVKDVKKSDKSVQESLMKRKAFSMVKMTAANEFGDGGMDLMIKRLKK